MSRTDTGSLDNQDPTKDTDGDKKPKSRRPASEIVTSNIPSNYCFLILTEFHVTKTLLLDSNASRPGSKHTICLKTKSNF